MKKVIISIVAVLLCGTIMLCVGVKIGKDAIPAHNLGVSVNGVSFASDDAKLEWESKVEALVAEVKKLDGDTIFQSTNAFGLFDVNLDGTPELIRVLPGGSAGNMDCEAYDIYSGECIAHFGSGRFNSGAVDGSEINSDSGWCTYYNNETQEYVNIGIVTTRGGADSRFTNIAQLCFNEELQSYDDKSLLYTAYTIDVTVENEKFVESGVSTEYRVAGNKVQLDDYINARDSFMKNYVRIDETSMHYVRVGDMSNQEDGLAKEITQALFDSTQEFVNIAED